MCQCSLPVAYKLSVGRDRALDPLYTFSSSGRVWVLETFTNSLIVINVTQQSVAILGGNGKVATENLVMRTIKTLKVNA